MFRRGYKKLAGMLFSSGMLVVALLAGVAVAASLPDPTRPPGLSGRTPGAAEAVKDDWQLGSILIASQRRVAVINGRPLTVGEQINGARLVAIEPGRVHLRRGSRTIVLDLLSARPKRSVVAEQN